MHHGAQAVDGDRPEVQNPPKQGLKQNFVEALPRVIESYSQELCMEKLGGDPFLFYSIHKLYSFYYLRQAFGMM